MSKINFFMSTPKTNFFASQLFELLNKLPQLPLVIFPGDESVSLDFSRLDKTSNSERANDIYKDIMVNDALLGDINYIDKLLFVVHGVEFYFLTSKQYPKIEDNFNYTASLIFALSSLYIGSQLEAVAPEDKHTQHFLKLLEQAENSRIHGPCVLLPCKLLDKLNEKEK